MRAALYLLAIPFLLAVFASAGIAAIRVDAENAEKVFVDGNEVL